MAGLEMELWRAALVAVGMGRSAGVADAAGAGEGEGEGNGTLVAAVLLEELKDKLDRCRRRLRAVRAHPLTSRRRDPPVPSYAFAPPTCVRVPLDRVPGDAPTYVAKRRRGGPVAKPGLRLSPTSAGGATGAVPCVVTCCTALRRGTALQHVVRRCGAALRCNVLYGVATCCTALQRVLRCCNVLYGAAARHCVATCCTALRRDARCRAPTGSSSCLCAQAVHENCALHDAMELVRPHPTPATLPGERRRREPMSSVRPAQSGRPLSAP